MEEEGTENAPELDAFDWGEQEEGDADPDVLRFDVGGLLFAAEAVHLSEVGTPPVVTEIPGLPEHITGVAVRRRHVLSILNLAQFLGLGGIARQSTRLLVFDADGIEAGILVDAVAGLEVWPEGAEQPNIADLADSVREYVIAARWAPGGRVLLLDMPEILRNAAVR